MSKYILKRIGYAILTIFVLLLITFFMMHAIPGNPFAGDKQLSPEALAALNAKHGLDKPIIVQFFIYVKNALHGDLGVSVRNSREVTTIIKESFPYSFDLGMRSLIIAIVFGIGLGAYAAIRRGKLGDKVSMLVAVIGVSVPSFIVAALLQYFLSLKMQQVFGVKVFPVTGWQGEMSKILPAIALSFSSMATISRLMRTSMLDVMGSDYIKTAKAKGLSQRQIVFRHALRNASMPVITVIGPIAASVLTGAFVVEKVFSIPGMGKFFVNAITQNDYPLIAGSTLFYGIFLVAAILIVDIAYGLIDPRINLAGKKE